MSTLACYTHRMLALAKEEVGPGSMVDVVEESGAEINSESREPDTRHKRWLRTLRWLLDEVMENRMSDGTFLEYLREFEEALKKDSAEAFRQLNRRPESKDVVAAWEEGDQRVLTALGRFREFLFDRNLDHLRHGYNAIADVLEKRASLHPYVS